MPVVGNASLPSYTTGIDRNQSKNVPVTGYDVCLFHDWVLWDRFVGGGGLMALCCPGKAQEPWAVMPKNGIRFKHIQTLLISDLVTLGVTAVPTVLYFRVPTGYDGVITDVICGVQGPDGVTGFVEGSGDLVWRLGVDSYSNDGVSGERWLKNLDTITTSLGSLTNGAYPGPNNGYIIRANNQLNFFVQINAAGIANLNPQARIVCSVGGWYYPQ